MGARQEDERFLQSLNFRIARDNNQSEVKTALNGGLANLLRKAFLSVQIRNSQVEDDFKLYVRNGFAVFVYENGKLIGCGGGCPLSSDEFELKRVEASLKANGRNADEFYLLSDIAVDKSYQGRGIGSAIIEKSIGLIPGNFSSFLAVDENDERALSLYGKFGFRQTSIIIPTATSARHYLERPRS